ncbi:hypothetical protein PoB_003731100 [Plakobranchus ocellatus]|uniref:Uncharacterized protein n=1 Tax=Plakobranchus ocellatus TaxID=259542 RepID=A0AAV4ARM7_9GAST|nr:hypothetical protein PoB_003731100 [Plakobranchus ocellatus]
MNEKEKERKKESKSGEIMGKRARRRERRIEREGRKMRKKKKENKKSYHQKISNKTTEGKGREERMSATQDVQSALAGNTKAEKGSFATRTGNQAEPEPEARYVYSKQRHKERHLNNLGMLLL